MTDENTGGALLRLPDVLKLYPVSRSTFLLGVQTGLYPKPRRISARCVAWRESDIRALITERGAK
jgi:predicted DNA-binding transcriptional regulator AlpA